MSNILIIDDQPHLQEFFSQELIDEGHSVFSLGNAEIVMGYLEHSKPDLVLLDLYLNGFKGWDLLVDIKKRYPRMPVIIVTAYDSYRDDPRLSQADGYILKNFIELGKLKQTIVMTLNRPGPDRMH